MLLTMNGNGTGKTGKSFQDRQLAGEVRRLTLQHIKDILLSDPADDEERIKFKQAVILKLAGTVLPRLNEHSGPDGEPIALFDYVKTRNNDSNPENKEPVQEN